jgi:hypothetical protein
MKALVRDIWNQCIAIPKNKHGDFKLQPQQLMNIVEKHLGKEKKEIRYKPFQINKTYQTKWVTNQKFTIKEIKYKYDKDLKKETPYYFNGVFVGKEHLGNCPLNIDRLIQEIY